MELQEPEPEDSLLQQTEVAAAQFDLLLVCLKCRGLDTRPEAVCHCLKREES